MSARSSEPPGTWRRPGEPPPPADRPLPPWLHAMVALLDDGFRVPGTDLRFGLDPIVGLLAPGAGDALGALATGALILEGVRRGVPPSVLVSMAVNAAIDSALGTVPVLGDLFDVAWKANRRNLELLERHAEGGEPPSWRQRLLAAVLLLGVAAAAMLPLLLTAALIRYLLGLGGE